MKLKTIFVTLVILGSLFSSLSLLGEQLVISGRWFKYGNRYVYLSGNGIWNLIQKADAELIDHNTYAANNGANSNRTSLFAFADRNDNPVWPWTAGPKDTEGRQAFDLDQWDAAYWNRAKQYLWDAESRGIFPLIQVFGEPYVKKLKTGDIRWFYHPFNPDNNNIFTPYDADGSWPYNDQDQTLIAGKTGAAHQKEFFNIDHGELIVYQKRFFTKALEELGNYPVIWDIANEIGFNTNFQSEPDNSRCLWIREMADHIRKIAPNALVTGDIRDIRGYYDTPVIYGIPGDDEIEIKLLADHLDIINVHGFDQYDPEDFENPDQKKIIPFLYISGDSRVHLKKWQEKMESYHVRFNKPLVNSRILLDPDYPVVDDSEKPKTALETRHVLWGFFFSAVHHNSFRTDPGWISYNGSQETTTEKAQVCLRKFIDSFQFWKCEPRLTDIVSGNNAVVLAEPGKQYAFYVPRGPNFGSTFTANLSEALGETFNVRWFNPRDGEFYEYTGHPNQSLTVEPANSSFQFVTPTGGVSDDWALLMQDIEISPPYIIVKSPNDGETWEQGSEKQITWVSHKITGSVRLELFNNGLKLGDIESATANDGVYSWIVGSHNGGTAGPGNNYKIRITSVDDPSIFDNSNENFTISTPPCEPAITVYAPTGGYYNLGEPVTIDYSTQCITSDVRIVLRRITSGGALIENATLCYGSPSPGSEPGKKMSKTCYIPYDISTGLCNIKVKAEGVYDLSARFTLLNPNITVTAPTGGVYQPGQSITTKWTASGFEDGIQARIVLRRITSSGALIEAATLCFRDINDGIAKCKIPGNQTPGLYNIKVKAQGVYDLSKKFTIQ